MQDTRLTANSVFWGEIQPCEHMVQLYETEDGFLASLEAFVAGGLANGESVVLIATSAHLAAVEARLAVRGVDLRAAAARNHYLTHEAEAALAQFMVDGWPDEQRFQAFVSSLLDRASAGGRKVRAFGEMVALLWAQGHSGATVHLEHLWHRLCQQRRFPLFCAYPRTGFLQDAAASIEAICAAHSRVLAA